MLLTYLFSENVERDFAFFLQLCNEEHRKLHTYKHYNFRLKTLLFFIFKIVQGKPFTLWHDHENCINREMK